MSFDLYDQVKPLEDFDWDSLDSTPRINLKSKDRIYCNEPYAHDLYNKMEVHNGNREFQHPSPGSRMRGIISKKTDEYATVEIGWREPAYIDLSKEDSDFIEYIQENSEIEVHIQSINNTTGFPIVASYTDVVKENKRQEIFNSISTKDAAYVATVKQLIYGGYFLDIDGVKVFMPGSQGGMNKLTDFEALIGKKIEVIPINYDKKQGYIVVSHREYLKRLVPSKVEKLTPGDSLSGVVTGTAKFGVFVEFNEFLTGLIHKSDLDADTYKLYSEQSLSPGDKIDFNIKEIVDPFRIVLSQKEIVSTASVWEDIDRKYPVPMKVTGKVKKIVRFGAFIEIEPRVVGLLHKSEIEKANKELEVGEEISVNLYKIDKEDKKLFLNFKF